MYFVTDVWHFEFLITPHQRLWWEEIDIFWWHCTISKSWYFELRQINTMDNMHLLPKF